MSEYDLATVARLAWHYGPEQAQRIVSGDHPETERDIARWRQIGGKPYDGGGMALARRLVSSGETLEDACVLAGVHILALRCSINSRPL